MYNELSLDKSLLGMWAEFGLHAITKWALPGQAKPLHRQTQAIYTHSLDPGKTMIQVQCTRTGLINSFLLERHSLFGEAQDAVTKRSISL